MVPIVSKNRMGVRAFNYQALHLWNQLPVLVQESDTLSTFEIGLKTLFFDRFGGPLFAWVKGGRREERLEIVVLYGAVRFGSVMCCGGAMGC